jgi:predicted transcriptional regulator
MWQFFSKFTADFKLYVYISMRKYLLALVMSVAFSIMATAQDKQTAPLAEPLPHKVADLDLIDLYGNPSALPMWGKKNLLIFYVDPDKARQNHEFTVEMEENKRAAGDNIYGFGIVNMKDSWYPVPDNVIRAICRKRTEKNSATIITDPKRIVAEKWGLGDCNNYFVMMIVTKEGELVYCHKGEFSETEKQEFYKIVDKYR